MFQALTSAMGMAGNQNSPESLSSEEEISLFDAGWKKFDEQKFWHAHEDWEDLWNLLKRRDAPKSEILLVQGLIQTAALMVNHRKKKQRGVVNQWIKLQPKLNPYDVAWGIDINAHLQNIEKYSNDTKDWDLLEIPVYLPKIGKED